ncbi:MAG: hypothetical protein H0X62_12345 [Bacteroidetes bacterium]|nr:hypothetical protein [Bacteroidota bacterium]
MKKETLEGNKLIAEFMGVNGDESNKSFNDFLENSKYHNSWDWLMPVVENIERHGCIVEIWLSLGKGCIIIKGNFTKSVKTIANTESNSTIESVWLSVLEYIDWHNKPKAPNQ